VETIKRKNEIVVAAHQLINPAIINMAAAVGKTRLLVKKIPRIVVISTGDELVEVTRSPLLSKCGVLTIMQCRPC
jgi:molybdopterin molybdotransferase